MSCNVRCVLLVCIASAAGVLGVEIPPPAPLRINGLVAATFTPFDKNGFINTAAVELQAKWLNETGVAWVFVSGTTGESLKLTFKERISQAELWVKVAPKYNLRVIIHVGTESILEAIELAKHAEAIGADAIGAMPSVFFKPATVAALATTMSAIFAAAPTLPAYYYHIPSMTGTTFPMFDYVLEMEKLGTAPNFAGIKYTGLYTNPGFMDATKIVNYKEGKYEVLSGRDEMMLEALAIGIKGFVGSQYNFAGDLYNRIRSSFPEKIEEARALQYAGIEIITAWQKGVSPGVDGCKNVLNVMDAVHVGDDRLPGLPMSTADASNLKAGLVKVCKMPELVDIKLCKSQQASPTGLNVTVPSTCGKPGKCGRAYQGCCAGYAAKGFPCGCHLFDGNGTAAADCGSCGTIYKACCAGFAKKGFPCTCDIKDGGVVVV